MKTSKAEKHAVVTRHILVLCNICASLLLYHCFGINCWTGISATFADRSKEGMPFRYFQKHNLTKARLSDSLNSQRWRFVQSDLDDFRTGVPPPSDNIIIQPTAGPIPVLFPIKSECLHETQPSAEKTRLKAQSHTSKPSPMHHTRKAMVAQTEYCLSQHPLALYPHLAESIPPELFREIVGILDPEMLPLSGEEEADTGQEYVALPIKHSPLEEKGKRKATPDKSYKGKAPKGKDPYVWFSKEAVAAREREAWLNYIPPLNKTVKQATKEFCRWFDSLGGEEYNIDEATIISLFDVGYEIGPPVSVAVCVVELNNLPAELRKYMAMPPPEDPLKNPAQQERQSKKSYKPKQERFRYGAWYLDPKTWKKQKVNEPLEDPQLEDMSIRNSWKLFGEKHAEIMHLHGTYAFKDFLERKGYQIPEFLQQMLAVQNALGPKAGAAKGSRNKFQRRQECQENTCSKTANELM